MPDSIQPRPANRAAALIQAEQQAVLAALAAERFALTVGTANHRVDHRELAAARHLARVADEARKAAEVAYGGITPVAPGQTEGVAW